MQRNSNLISLTDNNFDIGAIDAAFSNLPLESIIPTVSDVDIPLISEAELLGFPQGNSQDDILPLIDTGETIDGFFTDIPLDFHSDDYTDSYIPDDSNNLDDRLCEDVKSDDEDKQETITRRQSVRIQDKTRRTLAERIRQENQRLEKESSNPTSKLIPEPINNNLKRVNSRSSNKESKTSTDDSLMLCVNSLSNISEPSSVTSTDSPSHPNLVELSNIESELLDICDDFEDDDPNRLWCICRQPHGYRFMICCDQCDEWFHGDCVGISEEMGAHMSEFTCPPCSLVRSILVKSLDAKTASSQEADSSVNEPSTAVSSVPNQTESNCAGTDPHVTEEVCETRSELFIKDTEKKPKAPPIALQNSDSNPMSSANSTLRNKEKGLRTKRARRGVLIDKEKKSNECLASGCKSKINQQESLYCSSNCMEKYVEELIKMTQAMRKRRSNENNINGSLVAQQFVMLERRTGNVLSGKKAPRENNLLLFLKRYPTYEVIKNVDVSPTSIPSQAVPADKAPGDQNGINHKKVMDPVRLKMRQILGQAFSKRIKLAGNIFPSNRELSKLIVSIEEAICDQYEGRIDLQYQARARLLITHLKDTRNEGLFRRVLSQEIPPTKLVQMTSEQLSSPEIMKPPEMPVAVKSTTPSISKQVPLATADTTSMHGKHFFDINCKICTGKKRSGESEDKEKEVSSKKPRLSAPTSSSSSVSQSSNQPIQSVSGQSLPIDRIPLPASSITSSQPASAAPIHQVPLPKENPNLKILTESRKASSKVAPTDNKSDPTPVLPAGDLNPLPTNRCLTSTASQSSGVFHSTDLDASPVCQPPVATTALVHIKPETVQTSTNLINLTGEGRTTHETSSKKLSPLWRGEVHLKETGSVNCKAFIVSCSTRTPGKEPVSPGEHFKKERLHLVGRSDMKVVLKYLKTMKEKSAKDMTIVRFHPETEQDKKSYLNLYNYLHSRERCGVGGNRLTHVKDLFIFPLNAHSDPPAILKPFKGPGLEDRRPHLLLGIIVWDSKLKQQHSLKSDQDEQATLPLTYAQKAKGKLSSSRQQEVPNTSTQPRVPSPVVDSTKPKSEEPKFFLGGMGLPLPPPADDDDDSSPHNSPTPITTEVESQKLETEEQRNELSEHVNTNEALSRIDADPDEEEPVDEQLSDDTSQERRIEEANIPEHSPPPKDGSSIHESLMKKVAIPFLDDEPDLSAEHSPPPRHFETDSRPRSTPFKERLYPQSYFSEPPIIFGYIASRPHLEVYITSDYSESSEVPNFILDWNHSEDPSLTFVKPSVSSPESESSYRSSPSPGFPNRTIQSPVVIDYAHTINEVSDKIIPKIIDHPNIPNFVETDDRRQYFSSSSRSDSESDNEDVKSNVSLETSDKTRPGDNNDNNYLASHSPSIEENLPVTSTIDEKGDSSPSSIDKDGKLDNSSKQTQYWADSKVDHFLGDEYSSDEEVPTVESQNEEANDEPSHDTTALHQKSNLSDSPITIDDQKSPIQQYPLPNPPKMKAVDSTDDIQTLVSGYSSSDDDESTHEDQKEYVKSSKVHSDSYETSSERNIDLYSRDATVLSQSTNPPVSSSRSKIISRYKLARDDNIPYTSNNNLTSPDHPVVSSKYSESLFVAYSKPALSSNINADIHLERLNTSIIESDKTESSCLFAAYAQSKISDIPYDNDEMHPKSNHSDVNNLSDHIFPAYQSTQNSDIQKENLPSRKPCPPFSQSNSESLINASSDKPIFPIQTDNCRSDTKLQQNYLNRYRMFTDTAPTGSDANIHKSFNDPPPIINEDSVSSPTDYDKYPAKRMKFFDVVETQEAPSRGILKTSGSYQSSIPIKRGILKKPVEQIPLSALIEDNPIQMLRNDERDGKVSVDEKNRTKLDTIKKEELSVQTQLDAKPLDDGLHNELNSFYDEIKKVEEQISEQKNASKFISCMTPEEDMPALPAPPMPSLRILSFLNDDSGNNKEAYDPDSYDPGQWVPVEDPQDMDIVDSPEQDMDVW